MANIEEYKAYAVGNATHTQLKFEDSTHTINVDEPEDDGGSNKGPNPMQYMMSSLVASDNEVAVAVVKELGIEGWERVDFDVQFEVDLDGFIGAVTTPIKPFRKVMVSATVTGEVSQEDIDKVYDAVRVRSPIRTLFLGNGITIQGAWRKAGAGSPPPAASEGGNGDTSARSAGSAGDA
eukprot:TRINITY_DN667_c0_g1_i1.p1 TRINITY_DN667_c0_g1~~TRINITY_DN667_c0_g1_i1.p1  ORF type:complete len:179 (+),score=31.43 TRINITY_DN667_c0_g1_i1:61-597(+)